MDTTEILRRHYAEGLALQTPLSPELVEAFATVPREHFLGPGPWQIRANDARPGYHETPNDDPRHVYHDVLIGLVPNRGLNNGLPSFLALLISAVRIEAGEHVVHMGCGVGYYSAVMAKLVGAQGRVTAIEADEKLAARALENLQDYPMVQAVHGDALNQKIDAADVIFVNFGMTHALPGWIQQLAPGGRLLVPITSAGGQGIVFRFAPAPEGIRATLVSGVSIFASVSGRDAALEVKLAELMTREPASAMGVRSLRLDTHGEQGDCWLHGQDVCLSKRSIEPEGPLTPYSGTFQIAPQQLVSIDVVDGRLHSQSAIGESFLVSQGDDRFDAPGIAKLQFKRSEDGSINAIEIEIDGQTIQAKRMS